MEEPRRYALDTATDERGRYRIGWEFGFFDAMPAVDHVEGRTPNTELYPLPGHYLIHIFISW